MARSGIGHVKTASQELVGSFGALERGTQTQLVDDGDHGNLPHRRVRPRPVKVQLGLAIHLARLLARQLKIGEPFDEVRREHALLAVKAVASEPDQLLPGKADRAGIVELLAQLFLLDHVR